MLITTSPSGIVVFERRSLMLRRTWSRSSQLLQRRKRFPAWNRRRTAAGDGSIAERAQTVACWEIYVYAVGEGDRGWV